MKRSCDKCGSTLEDGELVKAVVSVYYKDLPSRVSYAISNPVECLRLYHQGCLDDQED